MSHLVRPERSRGRWHEVRTDAPRLRSGRTKPKGVPSRSDQLRDRGRASDPAVREAPLIVVPGDDADELAFENRSFEAVHGRAGWIVVEVDRNQRLVGEGEDSLQRAALGRRLQRGVDFLDAGVALRSEGEI